MNANEVIAIARRPAPASRCTPTTTSTPASPATTPSRPRSTSPRRSRSTERPAARRSTCWRRRWRRKATEFAGLVKSGRTHLMDATPVMLGQEFGGYAATVRLRRRAARVGAPPGRASCRWAAPRSAPASTPRPASPARVIAVLAEATGQPFTEARNHFEAQGTRDSLVELSGVLRTIAVGLTKICNDLRWMSSGPDAPASPRSTCPTCSRARASCPARSTRCCPRPR